MNRWSSSQAADPLALLHLDPDQDPIHQFHQFQVQHCQVPDLMDPSNPQVQTRLKQRAMMRAASVTGEMPTCKMVRQKKTDYDPVRPVFIVVSIDSVRGRQTL